MALFDQNRFRAFVSAFMLSAVLAGCGSSGGGGTPAPNRIFTTGTPTATDRAGTAENDVWTIAGDTTATDDTALTIDGVIDGADGDADEIRLLGEAAVTETAYPDVFAVCAPADAMCADAVVASIAFSDTVPMDAEEGALYLQNIETITLDGGTVNGLIDVSTATAGVTFNLISGTAGSGDITGSGQNDTFIIAGDITDADDDTAGVQAALAINGLIQGGDGDEDEVRLVAGGVVNNIDFISFNAMHLNVQAVEVITIDGGTVNGVINAIFGAANITFNLMSGTIGSSLSGSEFNDTFNLRGTITINGLISGSNGADIFNLESGTITGDVLGGDGADTFNLEGGMIGGNVDGGGGDDTFIFTVGSTIMITGFIDGGDDTDVLQYAGADAGANFIAAGPADLENAEGELITDDTGDVRNIESQEPIPPDAGGVGAGLRGLTVRGIEVLGLSPALNLYGAMSDALMQFGQQTAQGFALADLNLATGRATSLVSKDSPFTKGRIWAHKITHSGNGKGSIGLNLTGLTARAESDYDYEMNLTQHGFDAPLATTRLGAFSLRAVSHTMTGVIETNVAEANVSGYGAGVALLWNSGAVARQRAKRARAPIISAVSASAHHHHGLSAHITSLAGAYEVEAHTSPLNPRAVVNEVSEGSFSAINAVVSVGVADTRKLGHSLVLRTTADLVWQTLSLDDFTETGSGGIAINFDKATRFTARVGAGLESEHWFSDVAFVHETSSGGTLSSGLSQDYKQDDGTAIEMKLGGKIADLATGLTLKAYAGLRTSLITSDSIDPSARFDLSWRF